MYRSPNSNAENSNKLSQLLNKIKDTPHTHLLVMGDFNYKEINWSDNTTTVSENHPASLFLESIRDNYLHQHVNMFTRMRGEDTPHILDLVLTNEENMIDEIHYQPSFR